MLSSFITDVLEGVPHRDHHFNGILASTRSKIHWFRSIVYNWD